MTERSFEKEVQQLRIGAGETFAGEGVLAVTKALLQSGVGYVGGYQGAPITHLMDVFADANDILAELGVHFESSASEAARCGVAGCFHQLPGARCGDVEIDRRYQRRLRCTLQCRLGRG